MQSEGNSENIFPFYYVEDIFSFLRSYSPVGHLKSSEIKQDRIQVSRPSETITFENPFTGAVVLTNVRKRDGLYVSAQAALTRFLKYTWTDDEVIAFRAAYLGIPTNDDTGDYTTLSYKQIGRIIGKSDRTVARYLAKMREEFKEECIRRELIPPDKYN